MPTFCRRSAVAALALSTLSLIACGSSSSGGPSATAAVDGARAPGASPDAPLFFDEVFDTAIADLPTLAIELRRRVLADGLSALAAVNASYAAGTLEAGTLACVVGDWPSTAYYCGEDGFGEPVSGDGRPVVAYAYGDAPACLDDLSEGAEDPACVAQFLDVRVDDDYSVQYRLRLVAGEVVETLKSGRDGVDSLVDPEFDPFACEIELDDGRPVSFSNEQVCDESLRAIVSSLR